MFDRLARRECADERVARAVRAQPARREQALADHHWCNFVFGPFDPARGIGDEAETGDAALPDRRLFLERQARRAFVRNRRAVLMLARSEEHTSELQSLMRISYAVFCLK